MPDPMNTLSPEQVAFAELVGTLLARKWRREHKSVAKRQSSRSSTEDQLG
jgi:hypothetical protein